MVSFVVSPKEEDIVVKQASAIRYDNVGGNGAVIRLFKIPFFNSTYNEIIKQIKKILNNLE